MSGLPHKVRQLIAKAREAATMAVDVYNRPATAFRTPAYIILMIVAWTGLLHAIFERRKVAYYYRKKSSRRFLIVDGDRKAWELATCLQEFYRDKQPAARKNLEFFIGLRNKIEHRFVPEIDLVVAGECQSMLLNFEDLIVSTFGQKYSLASDLMFPLQFSRLRPTARTAAQRRAQANEFDRIKRYVDDFRANLDDSYWQGSEFAFRVYLMPKLGNRPTSSDLSVEFVKFDEKNPQEMEKYTRALTIIKEKQIPVANLGFMRAGTVIDQVRERTGRPFHYHQHAQCWRFYHVRPPKGDLNPANCDARYCAYDSAHGDYLYTPAWVEHLAKELANDEKYDQVCGPKKSIPAEAARAS